MNRQYYDILDCRILGGVTTDLSRSDLQMDLCPLPVRVVPFNKSSWSKSKPQFSPELLKKTEEILEHLAAGKAVASVSTELHMLFRPSIQSYMISWLRYDPAKEIRNWVFLF